ncbi:MAG: 30S ribosomal protein S16 [Acidimicrobiaceae bacterium]|nr:30S ribosomal protein S16 [Acidimicrobiaceae bacterium]MYA75710.1 30S ribosomal protein S16 [Acidimicrobiaceae bacterium]MYC41243.1 30S ribosomal protein S16 [Acidimicrobiaceae bacterium]MYG54378.1 30S ribosomal protein S16 [Acidimicrobiaceae bacterium]MYH87102.1 30S ribosomal protein S16 [Acidimicrobiaceae bacterium]
MAVKLRLMRMGKKKQPTYRVVAADSRSPRDGRFIEIIGTYEPRQEPSVIKIDNDRALHWLRHGAQPTDRVEKLLKISGAWELHTGQPVDQPVAAAVSAKSATSPSTAEATAEAEDSEAGSSEVDGGD